MNLGLCVYMETLWHGVEDNKIRVLVFTTKVGIQCLGTLIIECSRVEC